MAAGAIMGVARSREELWGYLRAGVVTRTTGSTNMNLHSSRSHAIFTLLVERTTGPGAGPDAQVCRTPATDCSSSAALALALPAEHRGSGRQACAESALPVELAEECSIAPASCAF